LATARPVEQVRAAFDGIPEVEDVEVRLAPAPTASGPQPVEPQPGGAVRMVTDAPMPDDGRTDATVRVRAQALDQLLAQAADPLTHLVRNAVDHGLETSAQRISMGKSLRGLLVLCARRERDKVLVEVSDDGAGFDAERLRQRAIDMGTLSPDKVGEITEQQSYELAF